MSDTKRRGFAMILAIFVVVLIAAGGVLLLRNSSVGSKSVLDNYLKAQAELLAQSATEYALMRAQGANTAAGDACLNTLNITVNDASGTPMFDINSTLGYSFKGAAPAHCTTLTDNTGKDTMVLIDIIVEDHGLSSEHIRVQKRSWQKL
ncbi:type II secretion system protein [Sulfuricurvum sp.]|uniref:type II secretion system protein n=1 Tax=Sulfuricurvum sp. TaxID=2025608 RepID=UPI00262D3296|nr:type II secretion system protein [Sulfuricurvum sp.]MDD3598020.1 type II secretion system protein [Sulfuricurvum sp.]